MKLIPSPKLPFLVVPFLIALFPRIGRCGENDGSQLPLMAGCEDHAYETHLISEDPLVIYIDGFITQEEALQLVSLRCVAFPHKNTRLIRRTVKTTLCRQSSSQMTDGL